MSTFIADMIGSTIQAGVNAAVQGGPRRQYKWNKRAAQDANVMNRENQQWLLGQERELQREQREYDSPGAQMQRYIAAGLNPNMIYGNGSSAGQAFPIHAGNVAPVNVAPPSAAYPPVNFIGGMQGLSQLRLNEARTSESYVSQALKEVQTDIAKTNPMLSPSVASWVSTSMMETARLKTMESRSWLADGYDSDVMKITQKVNAELEAAVQRLGLNTEDLKIKNQILESKQFENVVKELQAKWLKDSDVTPEHIRQALMLLLSKMIGR